MRKEEIVKLLKTHFNAKEVIKTNVIQSLWSGYGEIARYKLTESSVSSVIVKQINLNQTNSHPRGWNTNNSHKRKVKSYNVEQNWYQSWAKKCNSDCRVPKCYFTYSKEELQLIVLEDMDASGYWKRKSSLNFNETKVVLKWLANFHSIYINRTPGNLWKEGSYWHLDTRGDEFLAMKSCELKDKAKPIDLALKNNKFQTIIHGDAKVANFCFSGDLKKVAAVDFQYVGGGCGMKDVAYFIGSSLNEFDCEFYETQILEYYFLELEIALNKNCTLIDFKMLESEWRKMYPIAWADYTRFLLGWMPTHQKVNDYSLKMGEKAINLYL